MKRRIIGLAPIAMLLVGCGGDQAASLDDLTKPELNASVATTAAPTTIYLSPPPECKQALEAADDLIDLALDGLDRASDGLQAAADGFGAVADLDVAALEAVMPRVEALGQWFTDHSDEAADLRDAYDVAKADCLSA